MTAQRGTEAHFIKPGPGSAAEDKPTAPHQGLPRAPREASLLSTGCFGMGPALSQHIHFSLGPWLDSESPFNILLVYDLLGESFNNISILPLSASQS